MNKELYVSSTPHETKLALLEDDQLAEVYFERENEYTLAGSIYKGRVTRVLPGMQSAFVDIGLERDAFLYVSDFLDFEGEEDEEEFGEVQVRPQLAEVKQSSPAEAAPAVSEPEETEEEEFAEEGDDSAEAAETETASGESQDSAGGARRWRGRRRRRGRRGGRERGPEASDLQAETAPSEQQQPSAPEEIEPVESPAAVQEEQAMPQPATNKEPAGYHGMPVDYEPIVLPGESIARYSRGADAGPRNESDRPPEPRPEFQPRREREDFRGRRGDRGRDRERGRGDRGREREREPREEFSLPENYTPIVLPGESISKYRRQESTPAISAEASRESAEAGFGESHFEAASTFPAEASITAEAEAGRSPESSTEAVEFSTLSVSASTAETTADAVSAETLAPEAAPSSARPEADEPLSEAHVVAPEPPAYRQPAAPTGHAVEDRSTAAPDSRIVGDSAVAMPKSGEDAVAMPGLQGEGVQEAGEEKPWDVHARAEEPIETSAGDGHDTPTPVLSAEVPHAEQQVSAHDEPATTPQRRSYSPEGGPVVHEELEGEETDMPSYSEHFTTEDHQETVEQVFDRLVETANGDLLGQTVREADEEHALDESEYDFDSEEGNEFEESEVLAAPEFAGEQEDEDSDQRPGLSDTANAEPRAHGTNAGSQQRSERAYPDRGGREYRGRRGGRPMRARREAPRQVPLISDLLKEGQEVLIQIAKEPIGKKGARITSHIALPGRFLVYMPTVNHVGVSRKISSDDERQRLKRIVASERENGHGGFIVRTAASGIKEDELRADIRFLKHLWSEIRSRADNSKSPALIYHDLNLVERILRDQVTQDFSQIWVDSEQEYERVVRFASRFQPGLVKRIKLYTKPTPLFEQFGIQEEINKSLKSKVWLKSGGYIVINQTEALVAIDINTGKYVGKTARLEDTIVKTNCDAIKEIVRQIRLRDLGGIIVIDFIDMDERKNRQKVMQTLEEALKADRAPSKVLQFNDFGLVAITRKRVKQSLERTLGSPCPYCSATGFVKSVTTVCNEIYSEMRKIRTHIQAADVVMRVNPEVAKELKSNNGKWLTEMEELTRRPILVKSDALLHQEQFDIQF